MLTTSQSKVETSICTPFLSISHFCTTFRSPAAQESTGRNQPNRCVLHKARVRWRHRRLRHLCHRKKHSTRQKDKSIEKGITTIWNIYIYIILYLIFHIVILPFVVNRFLLYRGFPAGCPLRPPFETRWLCPTGRVWAREEHHGIRTGHQGLAMKTPGVPCCVTLGLTVKTVPKGIKCTN
jgi:hypothetical protein